MSVTRTILVQAKARISDPAKRTTGAFARDIEGEKVIAWDKRATCWCTVGALHATTMMPNRKYKEAIHEASKALVRLNIAAHKVEGVKVPKDLNAAVYVNDHGTHEQVMQMFDLAIKDTP